MVVSDDPDTDDEETFKNINVNKICQRFLLITDHDGEEKKFEGKS